MQSAAAVFVLVLFSSLIQTEAQAAPPKVGKTYEQCSDLATQRGFMANERRGARNKFVKMCMAGKIQ